LIQNLLEKGKPAERLGRKATGLSPAEAGYGSGVAGQTQHLPSVLVVRRPNVSGRCHDENDWIRIQEVTPKPSVFFRVAFVAADLGVGAGGASYAGEDK
jgi:hypothetical protein